MQALQEQAAKIERLEVSLKQMQMIVQLLIGVAVISILALLLQYLFRDGKSTPRVHPSADTCSREGESTRSNSPQQVVSTQKPEKCTI